MATVGSLYININARSEHLTKGLNKAQGDLLSFKNIVKTLGVVAIFDAAASAVKAFGDVLYSTLQKSMENIDKVAKLSDRLGLSTENLSAWGYAAALAGVDAETFNASLDKLYKNLGDAAPSTEITDGLKQIGLSVDDLRGLNAEQVFLKIADGIKNAESNAVKLNVAASLFGKSGVKMVNLFNEGSEGLAKTRKEADALGITFSRFDASKVEGANDSIETMGKLLEAIGNTIAITIGPGITQFKNDLIESATAGESFGFKVSKIFREIADWIAVGIDLMSGFVAAWEGLTTIIQGIVFVITKVAQTILAMFDELIYIGTGERIFGNAIKQMNEFADSAWRSTKLAAGAAADAAGNFSDVLSTGKGKAGRYVDTFFAGSEKGAAEAGKKAAENYNKAVVPNLKSNGFWDSFKMQAASAMDLSQYWDPTQTFDTVKKQLTSGGAFQELDLSNITLGGIAQTQQEQQVKDPQIKETNATLKRIEWKLGVPTVVTVG